MPEIIESDGDIFASGCEALVNPVDAETGAQGAGLAKEFKRRWPAAAASYKGWCRSGLVRPGDVLPRRVSLVATCWIVFAATKAHWRSPSQLEWIARCCDKLVEASNEPGFKSIGVPAIGCGLGELRWPDVRPLILAAAQRMTCERVVVFGPKDRR
jgi:O-acetyl-ADP-ribose deacetylase (regulator of RNase III)